MRRCRQSGIRLTVSLFVQVEYCCEAETRVAEFEPGRIRYLTQTEATGQQVEEPPPILSRASKLRSG